MPSTIRQLDALYKKNWWGSSVSTVTRLQVVASGVWLPSPIRELSTLPGRQCAPPLVLFNQYQVNLTTHFHLVPTLRMCGAIPPLSLETFMVCTVPPFTSYVLWYRHKLTRNACIRDGRATPRMRATLLLNADAVPQTLVTDFTVL
jgi:hypothetical protein